MTEEPPTAQSHDLFVSYASRDRERVLPIVERLEAAGVRVWIDREGISGGANYALEIAEAIEGARAILLMCSEASLASRNVKQEIALGWRFEKPYLPLLLEPVEIPKDVAYWLEAAQWVEVLEQPEGAWWPKLVEALARLGIDCRVVDAATTPVRERPLLVGREREQTSLRQQLDAMLAGHGSLVLVGGEAGIGKTTLVEDLTVEAEERGALVLWGHAYDLSVTGPYSPWVEMVAAYPGDSTLPVLPGFIEKEDALAALGSAERLIAEVVRFYQSVSRVRPLVLVLDDLHWFDQASLDLMRAFGRSVAAQRILIVCTFRSDEIHRHHALYDLLPLLARESQAMRLDVGRLDSEACRALVRTRYELEDANTERLTAYSTEHGEGNPLYVGELLRTLEQDGVLLERERRWHLGDLGSVRMPPFLRQVIDARLKQLVPETYRLLQIGAVIGQLVPVELWQAVSQVTDDTLIEVLEQGRAAQVLDEAPDGVHWRFRHALLREALYQDLVSLRRRALHRSVAEALSNVSNPDPDTVAHHFQRAGDRRAIEWLMQAGERAQRAYSWIIAADRHETALALMTEQGAQLVEQAQTVARIARLIRYVDPPRALTLMHEARLLAEEAGEHDLAAIYLVDAGLYQCYIGDVRAGIATMQRGVEELDALGDTVRAELIFSSGQTPDNYGFDPAGTIVNWFAGAGRLREAVALGEQRAVFANQAQQIDWQHASFADGWTGLAEAYAMLGQPERARQEFVKARTAYQAINHHFILALTYHHELNLVQLPYAADQPAENLRNFAAEILATGRRALSALSAGSPVETLILPLLFLQGSWDEAKRAATHMYAQGAQFRLLVSETLAPLAWAQGNVALTERIIQDALPDGPRTEPGDTLLQCALMLQRVATRIALEAHDLGTARAWLEAHDRWLEWSGAVLGRAEGALGWAEYHHASGDPRQARSFAEQALACATEPRQPLALLAVHRFLGMLDTDGDSLANAEAHLSESLRLADACAAPFERALTLLEIAKLRLKQGNADDAGALLAEVHTICEPLEAKPTLVRVAELEQQLDA